MGGFPPIGIIMDMNGTLSGTPTSPVGIYSFTVCAVDLGGNQSCKPTPITVKDRTTSSFDGTYWDVEIIATPLMGCLIAPPPMTVVNGVVTIDWNGTGIAGEEGCLQGTVDSNGTFTGSFNFCGSPTPIPVSGVFSRTAPFTLIGSNEYGSVEVDCQP